MNLKAMFRLSENRTTIIIAHRLSTVRNVDRILVMNQGAIAETGNHETLMNMKGHYHRLYTKNSI